MGWQPLKKNCSKPITIMQANIYAIIFGCKSAKKQTISRNKLLLLFKECSSCQLMVGPLCFERVLIHYCTNVCLQASSRFS